MTKGKITGLAATLLVLASASAFAQTPAPAAMPSAAAVQTAPAPAPKLGKVALQTRQKSCTKEWDADKKAGKTQGVTYKAFVQKCVHEGV
ncbi:MAG TPA: hypothetical protein VLA00_18885 [Xanthobacteraceae bacterium]|nr:hypothetical protein [Xanthobacteraceae bacterium]